MVKRLPFSPVDANRARKPRKKRGGSSLSNSSAATTGSLHSSSSISTKLSSLADDTEYDFLTNPKEEVVQKKAVVAKSDEDVWNSSTKTPLISNLTTVATKKSVGGAELQATRPKKATIEPKTNVNSTSTITAATSSTARSFLPPTNNNRVRDFAPDPEQQSRGGGGGGRRRRRRSKNDRKRRAKDDSASLASNASSLETIFEAEEEEEAVEEPAGGLEEQVNTTKKDQKLIAPPPSESVLKPLASAAAAATAHPLSHLTRNEKASSIVQHAGADRGESLQDDGSPIPQQQGALDHSEDMDETEIEDFLDLTLSPPAANGKESPPPQASAKTAEGSRSNHVGASANSGTLLSKKAGAASKAESAATLKLLSSTPLPKEFPTAPKARSSRETEERSTRAVHSNARHQSEEQSSLPKSDTSSPDGVSSFQTQLADTGAKTGSDIHRQPKPELRDHAVSLQSRVVPELVQGIAKSDCKTDNQKKPAPKPPVGRARNPTPTLRSESQEQAYLQSSAANPAPEHKPTTSSEPYQPEKSAVWSAAVAKPGSEEEEDDPSEIDPSLIGLLVETPVDKESDADSIDGSVLTQDDFFLIDLKQSHRKSKTVKRSVRKLPKQLFQSDLFKELRRKCDDDNAFKTPCYETSGTSAEAMKASNVAEGIGKTNSCTFKTPRYERVQEKLPANGSQPVVAEKGSVTGAVRSHDDGDVEIESRIGSMPSNASTNSSGEPGRREQKSDLKEIASGQLHEKAFQERIGSPRSATLMKSNRSNAAEKNPDGSSNGSLQVAPNGADTPGDSFHGNTADDLRASSKTNGDSPSAEGTANFTPGIDTPAASMEADEFPTPNDRDKSAIRAIGKGGPRQRSATPHPASQDSHSEASRPKHALPPSTKGNMKRGVKRPIPWTAELAGRKYRAFGVNTAPVFKLADGCIYRHPPLPPGWTIAVSRSKNTPFYIHPDFGATFYCPIPLPSADGNIVGTTLLFQADTPMASAQSLSSETCVTPAVFGHASSESASGDSESCSLGATPAGAFAVATNAVYSELENAAAPLNTKQNRVDSALLSHRRGESAKPGVPASTGGSSRPLPVTDSIVGDTPLGALAVATNAQYSGMESVQKQRSSGSSERDLEKDCDDSTITSKESPVENDDDQVAVARERREATDIPLVVEVVTKSGSRKSKVLLDSDHTGQSEHPPPSGMDSFHDSPASAFSELPDGDEDPHYLHRRHSETAASELSSDKPGKAVGGDGEDRTAATSLNLSEDDVSTPPSPANSVWFGSQPTDQLNASEKDEVVSHQRTYGTPSFTLAASHQSDHTSFLGEKTDNDDSSTPFENLSEQEAEAVYPHEEFDIGKYASNFHESPSRLSELEAGSVASEEDFPEGGNFEAAHENPFPNGGGDDDYLSPSNTSLPLKVIFGSEDGDDDVSRLECTPVHKKSRNTKISTRFMPNEIAQTNEHRRKSESALAEDDLFMRDAMDEASHLCSSMASRSYASGFSTLSRVSYHSLHPSLPLCILQNLERCPLSKKESKKAKKKRKTKAKHKLKKKKRYAEGGVLVSA